MGMPRKTRAELQAENRLLRRNSTIEAVAGLLSHFLTVSGFVVVAYFFNESIHALAGQKTDANIAVRFLANVQVSEVLAWVLGGAGLSYGVLQKRLREKTASRQGKRLRELESEIDPARSSSEIEE
jgi:hypothetical protein